MKQLLLIVSALFLLTSCNKSGDSASAPGEPTVGTWYWVSPASTSTVEQGLIAYVNADGTYNSLQYKATNNSGHISAYVRKRIGTYTKTGDSFTIKYTYETCSPISTETFTATVSANSQQLAYVSGDKTVLATFTRVTEADNEPVKLTLVEDTACNKF